MPTLRLPHKEDIHTAHHQETHWTLDARVFAVSVVDTDIQAPVRSSGIANTDRLEMVGKVAVAVRETAGAAVGVPCVVGGELIGSRSVKKEARMVVGWAERWTRFATEGHRIHYIAGMASGL